MQNSNDEQTDDSLALWLHRAGGYSSEQIDMMQPELLQDKEDAFMELVKQEFDTANALIANYFDRHHLSIPNISEFVMTNNTGKWNDKWPSPLKQNIQASFHLQLFEKSMRLGCFYQSLWHGLMFMSFMHGSVSVQQEKLLDGARRMSAGGKKGLEIAGRKSSIRNKNTKLWQRVTELIKAHPDRSLRKVCVQAAKEWTDETGENCAGNTVYQIYRNWNNEMRTFFEMDLHEMQEDARALFQIYKTNTNDFESK